MAWNQMRPFPAERLTRIRGWEDRGLVYWQQRALACCDRVAKADSGTQLGRAIVDRDVALEAVRRLTLDAVDRLDGEMAKTTRDA
jgi:hypothetical protein